jgi:hypothetical protein
VALELCMTATLMVTKQLQRVRETGSEGGSITEGVQTALGGEFYQLCHQMSHAGSQRHIPVQKNVVQCPHA